MADMSELRARIDEIDSEILRLFSARAEIADAIGAYKREAGLPVLDRTRERETVHAAAEAVPADLKTHAQVLMELLMEASRMRQNAVGAGDAEGFFPEVASALADAPALFPTDSFVACQGVEGAYSQIAAERIFKHPQISYFGSFEGVFQAVEQGFCDYGVLPVENSTAGSVNKVFDLMMRHDFSIVRTTRLKIDHNLLVTPGASLDGIREIYSHEQAIRQCSAWLSSRSDVTVHSVENTAVAAKAVAESGRSDVAALSSRSCAELYGLDVLETSVQDRDDNYTRFATISKRTEIFPGADRSSLMIVLPHVPGSLYKVLAKFYALDINIIKLESRPIPERDFEFMFFFDIECPVAAPEFEQLARTLPDLCDDIRYLGSYSEVV